MSKKLNSNEEFQSKFKGRIETIGKDGVLGIMKKVENPISKESNKGPMTPEDHWQKVYMEENTKDKRSSSNIKNINNNNNYNKMETGSKIISGGQMIMANHPFNNMNNTPFSMNNPSFYHNQMTPMPFTGYSQQPNMQYMNIGYSGAPYIGNIHYNINPLIPPVNMNQYQPNMMGHPHPYTNYSNPYPNYLNNQPTAKNTNNINQYNSNNNIISNTNKREQDKIKRSASSKNPPNLTPNMNNGSITANELYPSKRQNNSRMNSDGTYKPYTLTEYKQLSNPPTLGGLGANIGSDKWEQEALKKRKMEEYSKNLVKNHKSDLKLKKEPPNELVEKAKKVNIENSTRSKAADYCKKVNIKSRSTINSNYTNNYYDEMNSTDKLHNYNDLSSVKLISNDHNKSINNNRYGGNDVSINHGHGHNNKDNYLTNEEIKGLQINRQHFNQKINDIKNALI